MGRHNTPTTAQPLPLMLEWAFGTISCSRLNHFSMVALTLHRLGSLSKRSAAYPTSMGLLRSMITEAVALVISIAMPVGIVGCLVTRLEFLLRDLLPTGSRCTANPNTLVLLVFVTIFACPGRGHKPTAPSGFPRCCSSSSLVTLPQLLGHAIVPTICTGLLTSGSDGFWDALSPLAFNTNMVLIRSPSIFTGLTNRNRRPAVFYHCAPTEMMHIPMQFWGSTANMGEFVTSARAKWRTTPGFHLHQDGLQRVDIGLANDQ